MAVSVENQQRYRAILLSREFKWVFKALPSRWAARARGWLWRALFVAPDGGLHRAGEIVIADLRDYAFVGRSIFDTDPMIMARREGRREVVLRIMNYLELDEAVVQKIMELDDGI